MIVEDSADCAALLNHILIESKMCGEIKSFISGEDAVNYLQAASSGGDKNLLPHLIFLDLNLPGEYGLDTLVKIKKDPVLHSIPVLVMTASDERSDLTDSYKKGGTVFLPKPIKKEMLIEVLTHMKITNVFTRSHELK